MAGAREPAGRAEHSGRSDQYLLAGLTLAAGQAGKVPGTGQILSFRHPPALSGQPDIGNLEVSDFMVSPSMSQARSATRSGACPPEPRSPA